MLSRESSSCAAAMIAGAFVLALAATAGEAAPTPALLGAHSIPGLQLAAGNVCGPGRRQGLNGVCHSDAWFTRRFYCPPGMHLGPYGHRCWPN